MSGFFLIAASLTLFPSSQTAAHLTSAGDLWPGWRIEVQGEPLDLSAYCLLESEITNCTARPLTVDVEVRSRSSLQGVKAPSARVTIGPYAAQSVVCELDPVPWRLDGPVALAGLNGTPGVERSKGVYNVSDVCAIHVSGPRDMSPDALSVRRITVRDRIGGDARKVLSSKTFFPFVDRYGQFVHGEWRRKVRSDEELRHDVEVDDRALSRAEGDAPSDRNRFGGWTGGPQLATAGYFRVTKVGGRWWFVDPEGRLFWSLGVNCVKHWVGDTGITAREGYFGELPSRDDPDFGQFYHVSQKPSPHNFYSRAEHVPFTVFAYSSANLFRKYGANWLPRSRALVHRRMRAWGLNTIGNWSDVDLCRMGRTPYTLTLATAGAPRLDRSQGWWGPFPDPSAPEFERLLRERARANAKWMRDDPWCLGIFVDNELSWNGIDGDVAAVAEKYFSTVRRVLREELPNHLYLGCRIAWGGDAVYRVAAKYCDVVSMNIYRSEPRRTLPRGCADRPLLAGEFQFGAPDGGLFHPGLVAVRDQTERARRFADYVNSALDNPDYVGVHWFQWQDEVVSGRFDGENYQIGFVTIADRPYDELVEACREVSGKMYARRAGR